MLKASPFTKLGKGTWPSSPLTTEHKCSYVHPWLLALATEGSSILLSKTRRHEALLSSLVIRLRLELRLILRTSLRFSSTLRGLGLAVPSLTTSAHPSYSLGTGFRRNLQNPYPNETTRRLTQFALLLVVVVGFAWSYASQLLMPLLVTVSSGHHFALDFLVGYPRPGPAYFTP